jgi:hypothetical protein
MTIIPNPRDVLTAFKPKLGQKLPPPRFTEDDSLLVTIRDKIAEAKRFRHLRVELMGLLSDEVHEMKLEDLSRTYPGMISELYPETV